MAWWMWNLLAIVLLVAGWRFGRWLGRWQFARIQRIRDWSVARLQAAARDQDARDADRQEGIRRAAATEYGSRIDRRVDRVNRGH